MNSEIGRLRAAEITDLFQEGYSLEDVSEIFELHPNSIYKHCRRWGVPMPRLPEAKAFNPYKLPVAPHVSSLSAEEVALLTEAQEGGGSESGL
jgi:hypothetical protein